MLTAFGPEEYYKFIERMNKNVKKWGIAKW